MPAVSVLLCGTRHQHCLALLGMARLCQSLPTHNMPQNRAVLSRGKLHCMWMVSRKTALAPRPASDS